MKYKTSTLIEDQTIDNPSAAILIAIFTEHSNFLFPIRVYNPLRQIFVQSLR